MPLAHEILLVFAFVLALVGSMWNPPRVSLVALGFAAFVLAALVS